MLITEMNHIQITVQPELEDATVAWYRDVLGLKEISKPVALQKNGGAWFAIGSSELHVSRETGASGNEGSKRHVCYVTGDLAAARLHLLGHGVKILEDKQPVDDWIRFYVRDPAGNRVEIAQRV